MIPHSPPLSGSPACAHRLHRLMSLLVLLALAFAIGCDSGSSSSDDDDGGAPADQNEPPADDDTPPTNDPVDNDGDGDDGEQPETAFSLESSTPAPFASDVAHDAEILLTFSEALDPDSVSGDTVRVLSSLSGRLALALGALADEDRTLIVRLDQPLPPGATIVVELLSGLLAASGAEFEGETLQFRTRTAAGATARRQGPAFTALGRVAQVKVGDLNRDDHLDMVYTVENGTSVDILLGMGDGNFSPAMRIDPMQPIFHLSVADLDVDGDLDVIVGTGDRARAYVNRTVEEWDGAPPEELSFAFGPEAPVGAGVRSTAIGNLDFDALPDVVLSTDVGIEVRLDGPDQPVVQRIGSNRQARTELVLADIDENGTLDLLYGHRTGSRLTFHRGTGNPEAPFQGGEDIELGTDPVQIAVGNFVGDTAPEIVVLTLDGASTATAFRLLSSPTEPGMFVVDGSFGPQDTGPSSGSKAILDDGRFTAGDLNGDGLLDLALAVEISGRVVAFENNGGAQPFSEAEETLIELPGPHTTTNGDVDGDGAIDVVAASGSELHLLLATEEAPGEVQPEPMPTVMPEPMPVPPMPEPGGGELPSLSIDTVEVLQGATGASTFIRLTNPAPVEAYTTIVGFDPATVQPTELSLDGTVTGSVSPEFADFRIDEEEHEYSYSVLIDFLPPFEGRTIPVGENQILYRILFDVPADAASGASPLTFVTDEARGKSNIIVVGAMGLTPDTTDGTVQVLERPAPPPDAPNVMSIPPVTLAPGEEGFVPLLGTLAEDADAFTAVVTYDNTVLDVLDLELAGSVTEPLEPELLIPNIREAEGHFVFTAILDFLPPFQRQVIPPGADQELFSIRVRVREGTAPGTVTPLELTNGIGSPPLNNIFVVGGQSVFPVLVSGEVRVEDSVEPPPPAGGMFIRGDTTNDGTINLTDALLITNFLFNSGVAPECHDAADVDDDGRINLTDAQYILNFLTGPGPAPAPPFPEAGTDPTEDELPCDLP